MLFQNVLRYLLATPEWFNDLEKGIEMNKFFCDPKISKLASLAHSKGFYVEILQLTQSSTATVTLSSCGYWITFQGVTGIELEERMKHMVCEGKTNHMTRHKNVEPQPFLDNCQRLQDVIRALV